jgi:hypothetical protein
MLTLLLGMRNEGREFNMHVSCKPIPGLELLEQHHGRGATELSIPNICCEMLLCPKEPINVSMPIHTFGPVVRCKDVHARPSTTTTSTTTAGAAASAAAAATDTTPGSTRSHVKVGHFPEVEFSLMIDAMQSRVVVRRPFCVPHLEILRFEDA